MSYCTNYCDGKQLLQRHPLRNPPLLRTPNFRLAWKFPCWPSEVLTKNGPWWVAPLNKEHFRKTNSTTHCAWQDISWWKHIASMTYVQVNNHDARSSLSITLQSATYHEVEPHPKNTQPKLSRVSIDILEVLVQIIPSSPPSQRCRKQAERVWANCFYLSGCSFG